MEMMTPKNIKDEISFYELKLAKKRVVLTCYLIFVIIIIYFTISNKYLYPGLNLLIALNLMLLISPIKKKLNEIRTIKICVLLLGVCIDKNKDKKINQKIIELIKK